MYCLIGDKNEFAIELEIFSSNQPLLMAKSAIWIRDERIGNWEDENVIAPFLISLTRIAKEYESFWLNELSNLTCEQTFLRIHPFYLHPDAFYDLSDDEQKNLERFDKFIIHFGENFDQWLLSMVYYDGTCTFIWKEWPPKKFLVKGLNVTCHKVDVMKVRQVYKEATRTIPSQMWPSTYL